LAAVVALRCLSPPEHPTSGEAGGRGTEEEDARPAAGEALEVFEETVEAAFVQSLGDVLQPVSGLSDIVASRTRLVGTPLAQCPHLLGQGPQTLGGPLRLLTGVLPELPRGL